MAAGNWHNNLLRAAQQAGLIGAAGVLLILVCQQYCGIRGLCISGFCVTVASYCAGSLKAREGRMPRRRQRPEQRTVPPNPLTNLERDVAEAMHSQGFRSRAAVERAIRESRALVPGDANFDLRFRTVLTRLRSAQN